MVILVVGPCYDDNKTVIDCLSSSSLEYVDLNDVVRGLPRRLRNDAISKDSYKVEIVRTIEDTYGSIIVTGNIVLSEDVCRSLVLGGSMAVVVNRPDIDSYPSDFVDKSRHYWGNDDYVRYELGTRFKELHTSLCTDSPDNVVMVDMSQPVEDNDELLGLVEYCDGLDGSTSTVSLEDIISGLSGEESDMSIEDSIRKAMEELGVVEPNTTTEPDVETVHETKAKAHEEPEAVKETEEETTKAEETAKDTHKAVEPEQLVIDFDCLGDDDATNVERPTVHSTDDSNGRVVSSSSMAFAKVADDRIALMFPADTELGTRDVNGMKLNVLTMAIPDMGNRAIQPIEIVSDNKQPKDTPKPVSKPVSEPVSKSTKAEHKPHYRIDLSSSTDDLDALTELKSDLDNQVREARSEGDEELVKELRKQRRAVRNKINKLKQQG